MRSPQSSVHFVTFTDDLSETKVYDFQMQVLRIDDEIVRFDVSMNNGSDVELLNDFANFTNEVLKILS